MLKDNFSEVQLISEAPVWFYIQDNGVKSLKPIEMKLPTLKQIVTDPYLQVAIAMFNTPFKILKQSVVGFEFNNLWELLEQLKSWNQNDLYTLHFEYFLKLSFGEQLSSSATKWIIAGIELNNEWFTRIVDIVLIASGIKKFSEQSAIQTQKPGWLIEKEEEIRRIKSQGSNSKVKNECQELLKVLVPLNYELGYSFEELFSMNYFHIQALATYIPKIVSYDVSKRAVLSKKKIKYITEK